MMIVEHNLKALEDEMKALEDLCAAPTHQSMERLCVLAGAINMLQWIIKGGTTPSDFFRGLK